MTPFDWNFDPIPDDHLVACCYWEYARESTFLREFKSRCVEVNRHPKPLPEAFELCGQDARRVLSIGPVANSFLLGFGFAPLAAVPQDGHSPFSTLHSPVSGTFPAPWQSLDPAEQNYRAQLARAAFSAPAVAFQRATGSDALNALLFLTDSILRSTPSLTPEDYHQLLQNQFNQLNSLADPHPATLPRSQAPALHNSGAPPVPPLLRLDLHSRPADELALVQIQWGQFTDNEIIESFRAWLKANRPIAAPTQPARGHKLKDWRSQLTRLAIMRLLSQFSALDLVDSKINKLPAIWETKQFSGPTWLDTTKWHDARREARQTFHQLFPFLPPAEDPLSWPTHR